jgi:hypothetical protein
MPICPFINTISLFLTFMKFTFVSTTIVISLHTFAFRKSIWKVSIISHSTIYVYQTSMTFKERIRKITFKNGSIGKYINPFNMSFCINEISCKISTIFKMSNTFSIRISFRKRTLIRCIELFNFINFALANWIILWNSWSKNII